MAEAETAISDEGQQLMQGFEALSAVTAALWSELFAPKMRFNDILGMQRAGR